MAFHKFGQATQLGYGVLIGTSFSTALVALALKVVEIDSKITWLR